MSRAKELADAHWGYIESLLIAHGEPKETMPIVEFHYKAAFEHGYKHGIEDGQLPVFDKSINHGMGVITNNNKHINFEFKTTLTPLKFHGWDVYIKENNIYMRNTFGTTEKVVLIGERWDAGKAKAKIAKYR